MELGETGKPWSTDEVEITVEVYFQMLRSELNGERYNKSAANRELQARIGRSLNAISRKHSNISHILREMGSFYVEGYKPLSNVQGALRTTVQVKRQSDGELDALMLAAVDAVPQAWPVEAMAEEAPPVIVETDEKHGAPRVGRIDFTRVETMKRELGLAGEKAVMAFEQRRLDSLGRGDLAKKIKHVSVSEGDGHGYDIRSFNVDGSVRFIEVKTTRRSKEWPFFVSRNEVRFSQVEHANYCLYRLFRFGTSKQAFYALRGPLTDSCALRPYDYSAVPRSNGSGAD